MDVAANRWQLNRHRSTRGAAMDWTLYLTFTAATAALVVLPGPTIMLVVSYALTQGRRAALATILGVALGDITLIIASMAGMGALLAASAELFTVLKWIGALYLIWLGVKLWRASVQPAGALAARDTQSDRAMILHCWLVTALNPKSIAFFVAFLPQFLDPARPLLPQMTVMGVTFVGLAVINAFGYALLANRARRRITQPSTMRLVNRLGGSILVTAGIMTAMLRRV